ncbi:MAG: dTMP kinase [Beutenbergiaceae bacterium]
MFISFEGGDGAGKSTQTRLLAQWLRDQEREVVLTREPGGTDLGAVLRGLVLHGEDVGARTEALLYAADRAHHVGTLIRPALERGAIVISDRYLDSSVAYQGGGRGLTPARIEELNLWAVRGLLPDLTVLLDLDPVHLPARLTGDPDRLERAGSDFHARTRQAFLDRAHAHPQRFLVLDAAAAVDEVADRVRQRVSALLGVSR